MAGEPRERAVGTVRWFGKSWGAPINEDATQVPTPIDAPCEACQKPIGASDRGVTVPFVSRHSRSSRVAYHINCWGRSIVGDAWPEVE